MGEGPPGREREKKRRGRGGWGREGWEGKGKGYSPRTKILATALT